MATENSLAEILFRRYNNSESGFTLLRGVTMDVERSLIEATIQDLQQVHRGLLAQQAELDDRLRELTERIKQWQTKLGATPNGSGSEVFPATRRKRGETMQIIDHVFDAHPVGLGLTIREIAEKAELPWSSTRNVLQKHATKYEEREGKWYRKPDRKREQLD